ncbi:MAG: type IIA DNA topoisomerase subunit B [Bacteroidales bacterium]|nr:type IIA DNA topoisomerase subunit B [Bacteroidales bacterium]
MIIFATMGKVAEKYTEASVRSLDWKEHIRMRPGMYIGKLGDGASQDDGIYVLIKEIIDNSIDEFVMGHGKTIEIEINEKQVRIRDFGRGIPLGSVVDCVSKINTGAKYDSRVFKKAVGLNGVGSKVVNALSSNFIIQSVREGKMKLVEFSRGEIVRNDNVKKEKDEPDGTIVTFIPDNEVFGNFHYIHEYVESMLWNYVFLNNGLTIKYNGQKMLAKNGLLDLLEKNINGNGGLLYPIIHIKEDDLEFAFTHSSKQYGEEYYSFVNGQHTTQGGTHLATFKEAIVKTVREFFNKDFDTSDVRASIMAAISIKVQEPIFESQTKTKLGSQLIEPDGITIRNYVTDIVKRNLDNYLHRNHETAEILYKKILQSEKERKELAGIKKLARESVKKVSLHNKKLRDCRVHYNNDDRGYDSTLFITEGDSASGSITKARDVMTQAVFSLKGKPLNCFGLSKKIVYQNEEFNLLQSALNIDEDLDNLRYNNVVIATDADVDGMHIRLLLLTFFLQFYPELVKRGHVKILQTPLFRVRNKKETIYCYSEEEKKAAINKLGLKPEITRFKGLGEISPNEFSGFIGANIRLDPVLLKSSSSIKELLTFYMGKNTPDRQHFIIDNLRVEEDVVETEKVA